MTNANIQNSYATPQQIQQILSQQLELLGKQSELAHHYPRSCCGGPPGVGKSPISGKSRENAGVGFIDIRLSQREPVDLRGLPVSQWRFGRLADFRRVAPGSGKPGASSCLMKSPPPIARCRSLPMS
ncbi:hypothetical protein ACFPTY_19990 [Halomonas beimenensis]|uniref:hypothetical protein n=1 Tax=Halomonas beimenensis TaxID=475662 RepID=UPI003620ABBC